MIELKPRPAGIYFVLLCWLTVHRNNELMNWSSSRGGGNFNLNFPFPMIRSFTHDSPVHRINCSLPGESEDPSWPPPNHSRPAHTRQWTGNSFTMWKSPPNKPIIRKQLKRSEQLINSICFPRVLCFVYYYSGGGGIVLMVFCRRRRRLGQDGKCEHEECQYIVR